MVLGQTVFLLSKSVRVLLVGFQEWVVDVCLHLCPCTNVYAYFGFLDVFNAMTKTFLIPTPLHKQNSRKKIARQRKPKIYLEDKSDIAMTTESKTKNKEEVEGVMWSMYCNICLYSKVWGRKEPI